GGRPARFRARSRASRGGPTRRRGSPPARRDPPVVGRSRWQRAAELQRSGAEFAPGGAICRRIVGQETAWPVAGRRADVAVLERGRRIRDGVAAEQVTAPGGRTVGGRPALRWGVAGRVWRLRYKLSS